MVVEAALAHVVQDKVEAAYYARSDLFERRWRLMDEWAAYLAGRVRQTDDHAGDAAPFLWRRDDSEPSGVSP